MVVQLNLRRLQISHNPFDSTRAAWLIVLYHCQIDPLSLLKR